MAVSIEEVLRYLVEHVHFGSEDNRKEALEAIDKEYGKPEDKESEGKPAEAPFQVHASGTVQQDEDK